MKKTRLLSLFIAIIFLLEMVTPLKTIYGSSASTETQLKEKVYFQWMGHTYTRNKTGSPILRMTKVDYTTGLFSNEDIILDFINTQNSYQFKSVSGNNTKKPHISYTILKSGTVEQIISYDRHKKLLNVSADLTRTGENIQGVYPDAGMYVVKNTSEEYLVYPLSTNKLVHKTKQYVYEHSNTFSTNTIAGNYFYPEPTIGALYVEPRMYYDSKSIGYKTYPGEYAYEIKSNGKIVKIQSYKEKASDDFVFKKKLSNSVIFKQTKVKDLIKHELIINGKVRTLHEANMKKSQYSYANAQFSPQGKYVVLSVHYYENRKRVKGREEFQIFDARNGSLIKKIPINTTGSPSLNDFRINWVAGTDHIFQSKLLNIERYRLIESDVTTPLWNGNVVRDYPSYYTFSLDEYLTVNDPIPVSFKGKFIQYRGQGTFRVSDSTAYTPVSELMALLGGSVSSKDNKVSVTFQGKSFNLDSKKQIVWKNRTYYPLRELLTTIDLKLVNKRNTKAADDWREFQIIQ